MTFELTNPRCEYQQNPLGIGVARPRFSWEVRSDRRGVRQTAYQILAASSPDKLNETDADVWNSDRVDSDKTAHIAYDGPALQSRQRVFWTVRAWDEAGEATAWPEPQWFEMGLLQRGDWQGQWIGSTVAGGATSSVPAPHVRSGFVVRKPIVSARLYATALGWYECEINGNRVGDIEFAPGWTDYNKRVQYQTYDVTSLLGSGENVLGAVLGDGWYAGRIGWHDRQSYGDRPKFLAQLEIQYEDGTSHVVATNDTWTFALGPIIENDLMAGESYDARRELTEWSSPGGPTAGTASDARWQNVETFADPGIEISAPLGPPVRATQELVPVADPRMLHAWPDNLLIFDFGQNFTGRVRIKVSGEAGTTLRIRYAEVLEGGPTATEGGLYVANLRSARATDYYTLKGEGEEIWEPRFTYHGFRYAELRGHKGEARRDTMTGIVLHSDTPRTGDFECSDPLLNQLQKNIDWGQRGNFLDIPSDCPQRDERLGWMGDAQVFIRTAAWNRGVAGFFTEWARDIRDAQLESGSVPAVVPYDDAVPADGGAAWADAVLICPWKTYLCYGDARILEENYDVFQKFFQHQQATSRDNIRPFDTFEGFGDWLAMDNGFSSDGQAGTDGRTPKDLIATAFFAHAADLMQRIASILGKTEDAAYYEEQFHDIRESFRNRFITPQGLVTSQTQTGYLLALNFNLAPDDKRAFMAWELRADLEKRGNILSAGFVGSSYLNPVLTESGYLDTAYALLHQTKWPSWLYAVTQGATTIWERWDGWTHDKGFQSTGMNSFNHYAYGAIGEWLYSVVAGIDLVESAPGYKRIVLRPRPGGKLTSAKAHLHSMHGLISSDWKMDGDIFNWSITVPANTEAEVWMPCAEGQTVTEGGGTIASAEGLAFLRREDGASVYRAGSGSYEFAVA